MTLIGHVWCFKVFALSSVKHRSSAQAFSHLWHCFPGQGSAFYVLQFHVTSGWMNFCLDQGPGSHEGNGVNLAEPLISVNDFLADSWPQYLQHSYSMALLSSCD